MTSPKRITYARALVAALDAAKGKRVQERVRNFLLLLKKRGDMKRLPQVMREFRSLWQSRHGRVLEVVAAEPLQKSAKNKEFALFRKQKFFLQETIDPRVVAGLAFFVGKEYIVDGTVRTKLQRMFE